MWLLKMKRKNSDSCVHWWKIGHPAIEGTFAFCNRCGATKEVPGIEVTVQRGWDPYHHNTGKKRKHVS